MFANCNIETNAKQVTSFSYEGIEAPSERRRLSQEQLQREVDYIRAQRILDSMLKSGLISLSEFNKITSLNRKSFSPSIGTNYALKPLILLNFRGNMSH